MSVRGEIAGLTAHLFESSGWLVFVDCRCSSEPDGMWLEVHIGFVRPTCTRAIAIN